jgi:hypothetical protein
MCGSPKNISDNGEWLCPSQHEDLILLIAEFNAIMHHPDTGLMQAIYEFNASITITNED